MPLAAGEPACLQFQPNIFDSSRCHECLRQKRLHEPDAHAEVRNGAAGVTETVEQEDSDTLSVVSSYCDVSKDGRGLCDTSLCILSPGCDLFLFDGDDDRSSSSQCDDSTYSSGVGLEESSSLNLSLMTRSSRTGWTPLPQERDASGQHFAYSERSRRERRESGYFSLGSATGSRVLQKNIQAAPYRHAEKGHPLPGNRSPEPKAAIPFRNPDLGVPSERRSSEVHNSELLLTDLSRPTEPDLNVEALAGPRALSPTPFKQAESFNVSGRRGARNTAPSSTHIRSSSPTRNTLRDASPSLALGDVWSSGRPDRASTRLSRFPGTESRTAGSFANTAGAVSIMNKSASYLSLKDSACGRPTNFPPQRHSQSHQTSLSRQRTRSPSPIGKSELPCGVRSASPVRKGYGVPSSSAIRYSKSSTYSYETERQTPVRRPDVKSQSKDLHRSPSPGRRRDEIHSRPLSLQTDGGRNTCSSTLRNTTWSRTGSTTCKSSSLLSQPVSRSSSPSRHRQSTVSWETSQKGGQMSVMKASRVLQKDRSNARTPSPPRHAFSQSSMDSESSRFSMGSLSLNHEEYAIMADLPKVRMVLQREESHHYRQELTRYKPASHSQSKAPQWAETEEERDPSRCRSSSPAHTQRTHNGPASNSSPGLSGNKQMTQRPSVYFSCSVDPTDEEEPIQQPDLLNFKKGWMSKLDESGEWRKHWFVLTEAGLKYYRDSGAEERDEPDGEIDLRCCLKVCEFEVEKNYGFQIQTTGSVYTLSAMTAGIRRNWIQVLRKCARPSSSPDLTQLPDCSSDQEKHRHQVHSQSPASSAPNPTQTKFDYVELSPVAKSSLPVSSNQRELGEGQVREEQVRDLSLCQWDVILSRKGPGQMTEQRQIEEAIEKKWAEFERLPLKEARSLPPMGSRSDGRADQALEREVASLRLQLAELRGGWGVRGGCCIESMGRMEKAHEELLQQLEERHTQHVTALKTERDVLLREETQATARVIAALQKTHREELQKVTRLRERDGLGRSSLAPEQQQEVSTLQRELEGLSERYSQKCLELHEAEQQNRDTHTHTQQLQRDNQALQARLTEEMKAMEAVLGGQRSEESERPWCQTRVLLRVRENELQRLHTELNSLRSQLHLITTEKSGVCERLREVCEELSVTKSRSEREVQALREQLSLALTALRESERQ